MNKVYLSFLCCLSGMLFAGEPCASESPAINQLLLTEYQRAIIEESFRKYGCVYYHWKLTLSMILGVVSSTVLSIMSKNNHIFLMSISGVTTITLLALLIRYCQRLEYREIKNSSLLGQLLAPQKQIDPKSTT